MRIALLVALLAVPALAAAPRGDRARQSARSRASAPRAGWVERLERLASDPATAPIPDCEGRRRWSPFELLAALPRLPAADRLLLQRHLTDQAWLANAGLLLTNGAVCSCAPTAPVIADVGVTKTAGASTVLAGSPLSYALAIRNFGPASASGVTLSDTLPATLAFVSSTPGSPTCTFAGSTLSCALGTLANGATQSVTLNTTVSAAAAGTVTNSASASAATSDDYLTNNSGSALVTVTPIQPGRVPDTLQVAKNTGNGALLDFSWGASCGLAVTQYAVFEGVLGGGYNHAPFNGQCAVAGTALGAQAPGAGNRYYLIVPESATAEGSYGVNSSGAEIPVGATRCIGTQILGGTCP